MPLKTHAQMNEPNDQTIIRRYLTFKKFTDLILHEKIFLSNLKGFSDPWEGAPSKILLETSISELASVHDLQMATAIKTQLIPYVLNNLHKNYVYCFTQDIIESEPFWKLYSSMEEGVCIETTVGDLKEALKNEDSDFYFSTVNYYNPLNQIFPLGNIMFFINHKRDHFSFEKEFRLITTFDNGDHSAGFINAKIVLSFFIKKIILSPNSGDGLRDTVEKLCKLKNLNPIISKSQLYDVPINRLT